MKWQVHIHTYHLNILVSQLCYIVLFRNTQATAEKGREGEREAIFCTVYWSGGVVNLAIKVFYGALKHN